MRKTHIHLKFSNVFALTSFICNEISINLSTSGNLFPYSNLRECTHLLFKKNSQHSIKIEVDNEFCGFRNIFVIFELFSAYLLLQWK